MSCVDLLDAVHPPNYYLHVDALSFTNACSLYHPFLSKDSILYRKTEKESIKTVRGGMF